MRAQNLTFLIIVVGQLAVNCDARDISLWTCQPCLHVHHLCYSQRRQYNWDDEDDLHVHHHECSYRVSDCLLLQFQCVRNSRCISRRLLCNGIPDCSDGSDEWGCISDTTSSVPTTTSSVRSESTEYTSAYVTAASTVLRGNEENTPKYEDNTSSTSTATSTTLPHSETNTVISSSKTTNAMFPYSESNKVPSSLATSKSTTLPYSESNSVLSSLKKSTVIPDLESKTILSLPIITNTIFPDSESNTTFPSSTLSTMIPDTESKTILSSSTIANTMSTDSESNTAFPSSTLSTMIPESASNIALSSSTIAKTMLPSSEENTLLSTFVANITMFSVSSKKITSTINTTFPDSSAKQSCPDNHCMQNAECTVVQGQYRCKCPSSFIGELCEIQLGTEQISREYVVVIATSMTLVILCLAVVSVCIYRYKRLSSWKYSDRTSRTLSQLTLTSNPVE